MLERDRRSVITGTAVALLSLGSISAAGGSEKGGGEQTIEWNGQGNGETPKTVNCDGTAYWHWVLTPDGGEPLEDPKLFVTFNDEEEIGPVEGERQGEGAIHFEKITKAGGGTIKSARVEFEGSSDNAVLTIAKRGCEAETEEQDETIEEDDNDKPDEGGEESNDESGEPEDGGKEDETDDPADDTNGEEESTEDHESEEVVEDGTDESETEDDTPDDTDDADDSENDDTDNTGNAEKEDPSDADGDDDENGADDSDRSDENGSEGDDKDHTHC